MSINIKKKYDFPIIPHTHWDREWYFTTSRSKIYSLKFSPYFALKNLFEHIKPFKPFGFNIFIANS